MAKMANINITITAKQHGERALEHDMGVLFNVDYSTRVGYDLEYTSAQAALEDYTRRNATHDFSEPFAALVSACASDTRTSDTAKLALEDIVDRVPMTLAIHEYFRPMTAKAQEGDNRRRIVNARYTLEYAQALRKRIAALESAQARALERFCKACDVAQAALALAPTFDIRKRVARMSDYRLLAYVSRKVRDMYDTLTSVQSVSVDLCKALEELRDVESVRYRVTHTYTYQTKRGDIRTSGYGVHDTLAHEYFTIRAKGNGNIEPTSYTYPILCKMLERRCALLHEEHDAEVLKIRLTPVKTTEVVAR